MSTSVRLRKSGTEIQFVCIWSSEAKGIRFANSAKGRCERLGSTITGTRLGLTTFPIAPYSGPRGSVAKPDRTREETQEYVPIKPIAANWQATACRM